MKGDPLTIILIYRPLGSGYENNEELCEIMRNVDNQTIIIGDLNLPEIIWSETRSEEEESWRQSRLKIWSNLSTSQPTQKVTF